MGDSALHDSDARHPAAPRRCQKEHWALHRSSCRREPLHVWWRWVVGRSAPRLSSPLVVLLVCAIAAVLAVGMCRLVEPSRSSWAVSYRA